MYDENELQNEVMEEEQKKDPSLGEKIAAKNQRNSANNANFIRNAAEVASKTNDPYAKAIGEGVKLADKISGGRASQALGKSMNLGNKFSLRGRIMQAAINKLSKDGAIDKIGSALGKKNQNLPKKNDVSNNNNQGFENNQKNTGKETDYNESGTLTYKATIKFIITALIVMAPVLVIIIFCNLFISASQIYINSIDLGTADSLSGEQVETQINNSESKWDNEITDENGNLGYISNIDMYILDNIEEVKYVQVARENNEASLDELNDFYGAAIYESVDTIENIDMKVVYNFYYKLLYIYKYYYEHYQVKLDLPLLMATLNVYTKDKAIIFGSNTIGYDKTEIAKKSENERFAYDKVHNYTSTPTKGEYDIEVLAQHMVSYQATESCTDSDGKEVETNVIRDDQIGSQVLICNENQTYRVSEAKYAIDDDKYREFLAEFLEYKYFINNELEEEKNTNNDSNDDENTSSDSNDAINMCSLTVKGDNYYKIVNPQTKSCNVMGFYDNNSWGLEPKFYSNIMKLISDAKSHGCDAAIISGHRTYEKQEYFYNCYLTGKCNNGNLAAQPGYSNHEYGIAADLSYVPYNTTCLNYYHTNAYKYGLEFPLLHASYPEDWHIEPINIMVGKP